MKTEFMDNASIIEHLEKEGLEPIAKKDVKEFFVAANVIHCEQGDTLIVGMGNKYTGDKQITRDEQINVLVDGVSLCIQRNKKSLRLIMGKREKPEEQAEVENAVALMIESIKIDDFKIDTEVDGKKVTLKPKSFNITENDKTERWMKSLTTKPVETEFLKELEKEVNDGIFKWYKNVTGKYWSGRVGGLEVCTIDFNNNKYTLDVGKIGKKGNISKTRKEFLEIRNKILNTNTFSPSQLDKVASVIRDVANSRKNGALNEYNGEHLLESQVLCGDLEVVSKSVTLKPVCGDYPFQFPALWEPSANARFIDVLMKTGDIPYVVELKEGHSPGEYYRHGITQAVLYREFIKRAEKVHPWFKERGLDPGKCRAVVAFPELAKGNRKHQKLLEQHKKVAECFDVEIIEIHGFKRISKNKIKKSRKIPS